MENETATAISEDEFLRLANRMEEFFGVDAVQEFFSIQWEEEWLSLS